MRLLCHSLGRKAGYFDVTCAGGGDRLVNRAVGIAQEIGPRRRAD